MKSWKRITAICGLVTSVPFLILVLGVLPLMLIVVAIAGGGEDESHEKFDIWRSVKDEIIYEKELENDISVWLLSHTFRTKMGYTEDKDRAIIKEFIIDEMCVFNWREDDEDDRVDRFLTLQEILEDIKATVHEDEYNKYVQMIKVQYMFSPIEDGEYPYPLENFYITSMYGERPNPTGEGTTFHNGMDLAAAEPYAPMISIADGEVVTANTRTSSLGNHLIIKYQDKTGTFYGVYGHMSGLLVEAGDDVVQGEVIGFQGGDPRVDPNAGNTTGRHLHFEIRKEPHRGSSSIDPAQYIL